MIDRPRPLLATATSLMALLLWLAPAGPVAASPATVPDHDGATVRVAGVVTDLFHGPDGLVLTLAHDGHAVQATAAAPAPGSPSPVPDLGSWVQVTGSVSRHEGRWWVHATGPLQVTEAPDPARVDWDILATRPAAYLDRTVTLAGTVDGDRLHGPGTTSIRTGQGPWPDDGPVVATGAIVYRPDCTCHVVHAATVRTVTWTS